MPTTVAVIPTNSVKVYATGAFSVGNTYGVVAALGNYGVLSTYTYGGLQNTLTTMAETVVIPTGKVTVVLSN